MSFESLSAHLLGPIEMHLLGTRNLAALLAHKAASAGPS